MKQSNSAPEDNVEVLFPLRVIGALCALVFAISFCFEVLVVHDLGRSHQLLIIGLLLMLSGWAFAEERTMRHKTPTLHLGQLHLFLVVQIFLIFFRLALIIFLAPGSIEGSYGMVPLDLGMLAFLLPAYVLLFLTISRVIISCHTAKLESAYQSIVDLEESTLKMTKSIPVGTYIIEVASDASKRFIFASERLLQILQLSPEEILNDQRAVSRLVLPVDLESYLIGNKQALNQGAAFSWVGRVVVNGVIRWISVESVPRLLKNGSTLYEGVVIDVTDQKDAQVQLQLAHEQLTVAEVAKSRIQEREELLRDMHDGFGSQLASALLMAKQGELQVSELPEVLDECMADLHLVADTLSKLDNSLMDALADMRFRLERRVRGSSTRLHWDVGTTEIPVLTQRTILQILRIIQEALNNALKHANALNIWVNVDVSDTAMSLCVSDDGVGLPDKGTEGWGLLNMRNRAREIGADLQVSSKSQGVEVSLQLPLYACFNQSN